MPLADSDEGSSANNPITFSDNVAFIDVDELADIDVGSNRMGHVLTIPDDDDDEVEIISISVVSKKRPIKLRNLPLHQDWFFIDRHVFENKRAELGPTGSRIDIGTTVEFIVDPNDVDIPNDFMRVFYILKSEKTGEVRLRGLRFKRHYFIAPALDRKLNEVCLYARTYSSSIDHRPYAEQGLDEISANSFVRRRRLVLTDKPLPEDSFRKDTTLHIEKSDRLTYERSKKAISESQVLACRNIFIQTFDQQMDKKSAPKPCGNELRPLTYEEADNGGGLLKDPRSAATLNAVPQPTVSPLKRKRGDKIEPSYDEGMRRHTFGDVFCGAGGASRGAKMAGLEVKFGVDNNESACNTYRQNFRHAHVRCIDATDFAKGFATNQEPPVDILHMSPPCQFFSQAHTTDGKDDEKNSAALFTIGELIKQIKPRIATLEETSGLTHDRHIPWFYSMLNTVRNQGYSVRWSVIRCLAYGCTQPRPRLFLIASAPGVPLPSFPKFTHGPPGLDLREQGLLPFTTLRLAAGDIPRDATEHNPRDPGLRFDQPRRPGEPDKHSTRTLLTNNEGDVYHWSGRRKYTIREMACLQGFPTYHRFVGTRADMRRQIGNAVPPNVFAKIMAECIKVLKRVDGYRAARPRHDSPPVLHLDASDDETNVMPSIETAQEQEMRAPTFSPSLVAVRNASRGRHPRVSSVTIGPDDVTMEGRTPLPQQVMNRIFGRVPGGVMGDVLVEGRHEGDETLELADGDASDDDAPMPNAFTMEESPSPGEQDRRSATIAPESHAKSPSVAASDEGIKDEVMVENMGEDVNWATTDDEDTSDEDTDTKPPPEASEDTRRTSEYSSPDPTVAARGMMRSMSLQGPYVDGEGEVSERPSQGDPAVRDSERVVIVIDDD
ncbi:S-adenosyl-L-methionine-dependent methyltransferase [Phyllosticta citribraziliensis]|uniref:DNA (cytosine-5-)-methyltransferase n=1 Tax=Phyllosticta citribraziliensis TaxID=989973 RepID=A0ABR1LNX5_9PEZI